MLLKFKDKFHKKTNDKLIVITNSCLVPYVWPQVYNEFFICHLATNTKYKILRHINHFYEFLDTKLHIFPDKIFDESNLDNTKNYFFSYYCHLCNDLEPINNEIWADVVVFYEKIQEFKLNTSNNINFELKESIKDLSEKLSQFKFRKSKKILKIKSLPPVIIDYLDEILVPGAVNNPFKHLQTQWKYYVAYILLSYVGLRRGELLLLNIDSFFMTKSFKNNKNYYYLNVQNNESDDDERFTELNLKNQYATRQIPIGEDIYKLLKIYCEGYRPRSYTPFIFISNRHKSLSVEALNKTFLKIYQALPIELSKQLEKTHGLTSLSPHMLRHTAASICVSLYPDDNRDNMFAVMRSYFGWWPDSKMPAYYASSAFNDQMQAKYLDILNRRISTIERIFSHD